MKYLILFPVIFTMVLSACGAEKNAPPSQKQTLCPIMNAPINKDIYVDYQGQRVYFCCNGCQAAFNKDPAKYMEQMKKEGVVLEPVQETPAVENKAGDKHGGHAH